MSVIPVIQEADIRRIKVQSQPSTNSSGGPILEKTHHKKRAGRVAQVIRVPV
jgi:hypothetical protein